MKRFQRIDANKELINHFINKLNEIGYKKVQDCTGGDEDFLMVDTFNKEYIWCEFGFSPFCSDEDMFKHEFNENPKSISLKSLENNRY